MTPEKSIFNFEFEKFDCGFKITNNSKFNLFIYKNPIKPKIKPIFVTLVPKNSFMYIDQCVDFQIEEYNFIFRK